MQYFLHTQPVLSIEMSPCHLTLKGIAGSYVFWYNWKYNRNGHLFQDKFKSEPVEDDRYFLTVFRYIHQNPTKANLVTRIDNYQYSSYNDYINDNNELVEIDFVLNMMDKNAFIRFNKDENDDKCLDDEKIFRLNDNEAKIIIEKVSKCKDTVEFQDLDLEKRNKYIKELKT